MLKGKRIYYLYYKTYQYITYYCCFDFRSQTLKYIDIWLSDLMWPSSGDLFSVAALFMLQLACILNTQSNWKKLKLRIMFTDTDSEPPSQNPSSFSLNQGKNYTKEKKFI